MNYNAVVNWMFRQLPMYQHKGASAYKKDLSNTHLLAKHLNNPERAFKSIHVGGTNGKGSTSHMLASILQEAGYKVGLYTSPHLKDYRERVKINGVCISKKFVIEFINTHKLFFESHMLSFFEMTVGLAFDYFAKEAVDIALIEVGMGGRLDSTNIIQPEVSVITNIGLDHTRFLGDTLEKIAIEKAGIIKKKVPVVIGETQNETKTIFEAFARDKQAPIVFADTMIKKVDYESDLKGFYQSKNIKTVLSTIIMLKEKGFDVSDVALKKGLLNVVNNTGLLGRWQILQQKPKIICDTAHNTEGLSLTMAQVKTEHYKTLRIVFGVVSDKDLSKLFAILPKSAIYYFCKPAIERGLDARVLKEQFEINGFSGRCYESVEKALSQAKKDANQEDLIYVGGSTFVVAEVV